jgi:hypothetical protein
MTGILTAHKDYSCHRHRVRTAAYILRKEGVNLEFILDVGGLRVRAS